MTVIRIAVIDPSQTSKTMMEVPDDVSIDQLTDAMVEAMGLLVRDSNGKKLKYHLSLLGKNEGLEKLKEQYTLAENSVQNDAVLQLSVEALAACFLPGTMITQPGRAYIPIENIKRGDKVLSYDTRNKAICTGIVSDVFVGEAEEYLVINNKLHITESHLVFCNDEWKQARYITKGDYLCTEDGINIRIDSIKTETAKTVVYNLHLATRTHTFFAEKILVHNLLEKLSTFGDKAAESFALKREYAAHPDELKLSPESVESIAEIISRKVEAILLVKLGKVTELTEDEKKLVKGTMVVRPSFGVPSDMPQYKSDVFMIMPFRDEFEAIYRHFIVQIVKSFNLTIKRGDDFFSSLNSNIMDEVWSAIYSSRFIIADCTGRNPNVFYELGIAHVLGKPTILLTQNIDDVPFDVQNKRFVKYQNNAEGLRDLEVRLREIIKRLIAENER